MRNTLLKILLAGTLFAPLISFGQLDGFQMFWHFSKADGNNIRSIEDVCDCGTIYLKNASTYDNHTSSPASIGSGLTTGVYKVRHYPTNYEIAVIPASSWPADGVVSVNLPCLSTVPALANPGYLNNLRVMYVGTGASPSPCSFCKHHHTWAVRPWPLPNVNAASDVTICEGETATLTASGTSGTVWTWSPGGFTGTPITVSPGTTTTYTLTGTKTYTGHNPGSSWTQVNPVCTATDNATVTVLPTPDVDLDDYLLCDGDPFPVLDAGPGHSSYIWTFDPDDGPPLPFAVGTGQTLATSPTLGFGTYTVTVVGANGCETIASATIGPHPSAGSEIDAGFTATTSTSGSTMIINGIDPIDPDGDHVWMLETSTGPPSCTPVTSTTSYITQYGTTASWTVGLVPSGQWYRLTHIFKKAPCNEPDTAYTCVNQAPIFGFVLHPNPTNGQFTITLQNRDPQQTYNGFIANSQGTIINQFQIQGNSIQRNITGHPNGLYTVTVRDGNNTTVQQQLIKGQ